jgi:hypothetical protein
MQRGLLRIEQPDIIGIVKKPSIKQNSSATTKETAKKSISESTNFY